METDIDSVFEKAFEAKEKIKEAGYHVSIGTASGEGSAVSIVKVAEIRMYEDKKRYYMEHGDRRKNGPRTL